MTSPETAIFGPIATTVMTRHGGSGAEASAVAVTAGRAYDDLAGVLIPLIGQVGFDAVTMRALYLAQREYPPTEPGNTELTGHSAQVIFWLEQQDEARAVDAAATILATLGGLLAAFIGEPLTMRLVRKAWPDGFSDTHSQEIPT